jgi:hypothetical protein
MLPPSWRSRRPASAYLLRQPRLLLTWQRRPRATRTAVHPHLHDRLRPAQLGVRHPHLPLPPPGIPRQRHPGPQRLVHRIDHHRTRRHARPAHQPAPSTKATPALLSSIAIAAITITLPYSPLAGPLGLTAVPAWILAALAGLTAFYVIANETAPRRTQDRPSSPRCHVCAPASVPGRDRLLPPAAQRSCEPRRTGRACVAVRNGDLAAPITGMPNSRARARPGRAGRPRASRPADRDLVKARPRIQAALP